MQSPIPVFANVVH